MAAMTAASTHGRGAHLCCRSAMTSAPNPPAGPPLLPDGWTVRPDPRTWRVDGGATWIGGSPPRVLRLSPAARSRLAGSELVVADATTAALARLLADAGVAHPDPARAPEATRAGRRHRRRARCATGPTRARPAARGRRRHRARARRDRRRRRRVGRSRVDGARRGDARRAGRAAPVVRGPSAARNTGARASSHADRGVPRLRRRSRTRVAGGAAPAPRRPGRRRGRPRGRGVGARRRPRTP